MPFTLIDIARARRKLDAEKKRISDEIRRLRQMPSANKPAPILEVIQGQKPAA